MEYVARPKKLYTEKIVPAMMEEFGYKSIMQVPKLEKIVVSQGVGAATADKKIVDYAVEELTAITGQKAVGTLSKKDEAAFKLRKGMPVGARVTLRAEKMYEFLDRLTSSALPSNVKKPILSFAKRDAAFKIRSSSLSGNTICVCAFFAFASKLCWNIMGVMASDFTELIFSLRASVPTDDSKISIASLILYSLPA